VTGELLCGNPNPGAVLNIQLFMAEIIKVSDCSVFGKVALRLLAALQQGKHSVAEYAIEFRTLVPTMES